MFDPSLGGLKKQCSLKTQKAFQPRHSGVANVGRKLPTTLSIDVGYSNIFGFILRILGSFLLRLCAVESKPRLRVPQVLSVLIPFVWRVKRPDCRGKRLNFIDRRLMFCLRTNVMCRYVREILLFCRNAGQ